MKRTIYDEDHEAFRASVKEFLDRQVVPNLEEHAAGKAIPREFWLEAGKQGFLGLEIPEAYGGSEAGDYRFNAVLTEELAKVNMALPSCVGIHADIVAPYLVHLTTDEQKKRWLPGFCSGELLTAIGMTEPSGGSDLAALKTTAVRDGDYWVLNGSKTFITNGYSADLVIVAARTSPEKKARGITLFGVETDRPGFSRGRKLNANDGIVSTAGLVVGVAGATSNRSAIVVAGVAGLAAGALSMGAGEYVSVSTQRDSEHALLEKERRELAEDPEEELAELADIYVGKGLSEGLALQVARELTEHDALGAHAEAELGIDPDDLTNPWSAAWASMLSFTVGALLPLLTIALVVADLRVPVTIVAVVLALALTGWASARFGYGPAKQAVLRNMGGGLFAMLVTYGIGALVGQQV